MFTLRNSDLQKVLPRKKQEINNTAISSKLYFCFYYIPKIFHLFIKQYDLHLAQKKGNFK